MQNLGVEGAPNELVGFATKPTDIASVVEVDLVREKDIRRQDRVQLSNEVAHILSRKLGSNFKGNPETVDLILLTRVFVVSNGSPIGRKWYGKLGFGWAKLSVGCCLFSRHQGCVLLAKQLFLDDDGLCGYLDVFDDRGPMLVREMALRIAKKIRREVECSTGRNYG
jgi:hypothetical protein